MGRAGVMHYAIFTPKVIRIIKSKLKQTLKKSYVHSQESNLKNNANTLKSKNILSEGLENFDESQTNFEILLTHKKIKVLLNLCEDLIICSVYLFSPF